MATKIKTTKCPTTATASSRVRVAKKRPSLARVSATHDHDHEQDYHQLLRCVRATFSETSYGGSLFTTDADMRKAFALFLRELPTDDAERQVHTCSACRKFFIDFGGLVVIDPDGRTRAAVWDHVKVPAFYHRAIAHVRLLVERAAVTGVFYDARTRLGRLENDSPWVHLTVMNTRPYAGLVKTARQAMAAKREDHGTLMRAINEFSYEQLVDGLAIIEGAHVDRSERFVAPMRWLKELKAKVLPGSTALKARRFRDNHVWHAVATAPDGFCHPRAGMIGSLLEDLATNLSIDDIRRRFNAKVHPLAYQRPKAPPARGNVERGEEIVKRLGLESALRRRFARLDEIPGDVILWLPDVEQTRRRRSATTTTAASPGVFSRVMTKERLDRFDVGRRDDLPSRTMTWVRFREEILGTVDRLEAFLPSPASLTAITTASDPTAQPLFKWDNPFAWYTYHNGSPPSQWGLNPGWNEVTGVVPLPTAWSDPQAHLGNGVIAVIRGCQDLNQQSGLGLFPECLRGELHEIRSTIEAYSRQGQLEGRDEASVCGLDFRARSGGEKHLMHRLRATVDGRTSEYLIDRWS